MAKREEIIPFAHFFLDGMVEKGWYPKDYAIEAEVTETTTEDGSLAIEERSRTLRVVFERVGENETQC